jgi:hypothetical protein
MLRSGMARFWDYRAGAAATLPARDYQFLAIITVQYFQLKEGSPMRAVHVLWLAVIVAASSAKLAAPAKADWGYWHHWHRGHWDHDDWHHSWRHHDWWGPRVFVAPSSIYDPPPRYYYAPPACYPPPAGYGPPFFSFGVP